MSIKNPYRKEITDSSGTWFCKEQPEHNAFNEGVEATNKDWITIIQHILNNASTKYAMEGSLRNLLAERKKEIKQ